jgi:hypothetical protein
MINSQPAASPCSPPTTRPAWRLNPADSIQRMCITCRGCYRTTVHLNYLGAVVLLSLLSACSEGGYPANAVQSVDLQAIERKHDEITQSSVISDFVGKVTSENYADALLLLHPELADAWTIESFTQDWSEIRSQLAEQWAPESTGTFSGMSAQGQYEQASYRLSSDWHSLTSLDLTSMIVDDASRIVQIRIRTPYEESPPDEVVTVAENFIDALSNGDVAAAHELMAAATRPLIPVDMLEQLKSICEGSPFDGEKNYYRLSAETIWYDAMRCTPSNEPATFLELIIDSSGENAQVVSLSFKMRP